MNLSNILSQFEAAKSEIEQLKGGRKISASRARAALMKVKKESDTLRKEILLHSKGLPVKNRKTKIAVANVIAEPAVVVPEKPKETQPAEAKPSPTVAQPNTTVAQPSTTVAPKAAKTTKQRVKKDVVLSAR